MNSNDVVETRFLVDMVITLMVFGDRCAAMEKTLDLNQESSVLFLPKMCGQIQVI